MTQSYQLTLSGGGDLRTLLDALLAADLHVLGVSAAELDSTPKSYHANISVPPSDSVSDPEPGTDDSRSLAPGAIVPQPGSMLEGGWQVTAVNESTATTTESHTDPTAKSGTTFTPEQTRRLGDPLAFAFLQWPAVIALFATPDTMFGWLCFAALVVYLLIMSAAAFSGRYKNTPRFGSALLWCLACVAGFWWSHPANWQFLWLVLLVFGFHAAQRASLEGTTLQPTPGKTAG